MTLPLWLEERSQEACDRFYWKNGPCCSGCDWWARFNSLVGECRRSAPVSAKERWAMVGVEDVSLRPGAGHVVTDRSHRCGEFKDDFDWSSLPPHYLRKIGAPVSRPLHVNEPPKSEHDAGDVLTPTP